MGAPVRVLFFATAREAVGRRALSVTVPTEGLRVAALLGSLGQDYPGLGRVLRASRIVLNGQFVEPDRVLARPGDELAIHPPYSGG